MRVWRSCQFVYCLIALVMAASAGLPNGSQAVGQEVSETGQQVLVARGLRNRGLYQLADSWCRDRLAMPEIDPVLQADLTVEQILVRTAQAMSTGTGTDEVWQQVTLPGLELLATAPEHPRRLLVEFQMLLVPAAQAQSIRRNVRFGILPPESLAEAIRLYEQVQLDLKDLQRKAVEATARAIQRPGKGAELSVDRLQAISASANFQMASCLNALAGLYGSRDRLSQLDALNVVFEKLEAVRRQTGADSDLNQACELLRVEALRSGGMIDQAQSALMALDANALSEANRQTFWQQSLAQAMAGAGSDTIAALVRSVEQARSNAAETEIGVLEFLNSPVAKKLGMNDLAVARDWAERIQLRFGPAWGRVANRILLEMAGQTAAGGETNRVANGEMPGGAANTANSGIAGRNAMAVDLALRTAQAALDKERTSDAIEALRTAAKLLEPDAASEEQIREVFRIRIQTGGLLASGEKFVEAAEELRAVCEKFSAHSLAAAIHRRACWYADQVPSDENDGKLFLEYAENQIARWGSADATDEIRMQLAQLFYSRRDWDAALGYHLDILPMRRLAATSAAGIVRVLDTSMRATDSEAALKRATRIDPPIRQYAAEMLSSSHAGNPDAGWKLLVALDRLGLELGFAKPEIVLADLHPLFQDDISVNAETREQGRVVAAAAQILGPGDLPAIEQLMDQIEASDNADQNLVELLRLAGREDFRDQKRELLELLLKQTERLDGRVGDGEAATPLAVSRGKLLMALDQPQEAALLLGSLAGKRPDDLTIQMLYARTMGQVASRAPVQIPEALAVWRKTGGRLQPQSEAWFESKHETARLMLLNGQAKEAGQMLEFLKTVPPGWSQSSWSEKLDQLLLKCRQQRP